jgi:hypothetical protein
MFKGQWGRGGLGAPPHVVEIGVDGTELAPQRGLVRAGQGVVDDRRLGQDGDGDLHARRLPGLLQELGGRQGLRVARRVERKGDRLARLLLHLLDQLGGLPVGLYFG